MHETNRVSLALIDSVCVTFELEKRVDAAKSNVANHVAVYTWRWCNAHDQPEKIVQRSGTSPITSLFTLGGGATHMTN
jgi:hypothetical protein